MTVAYGMWTRWRINAHQRDTGRAVSCDGGSWPHPATVAESASVTTATNTTVPTTSRDETNDALPDMMNTSPEDSPLEGNRRDLLRSETA